MRHAVPLLPHIGAAQTKVSRQVDDPNTGLQQHRDHAHCRTVGRGEKHQLTGLQHGDIGNREFQLQTATKIGEQFGNQPARLGTRGDNGKLDTGVSGEQAQ
jgi:hypothetical protein